jgi:hypothetical protein
VRVLSSELHQACQALIVAKASAIRGAACGRVYINFMYPCSCGKPSSSCTSLAQSSVYASTKSATVTVASYDELPALHVFFEHTRHGLELLAGEHHVAR